MAESMTSVAGRRILVVEDSASISDVVATALRHDGHDVVCEATGDGGFALASTGDFDLIVLDVMLPGLDGVEICRRLRRDGETCPILFLTARGETHERVEGFLVGADDYLTKPFAVAELRLRVTAILRRASSETESNRFVVDDLVLDVATRDVRRNGVTIDLSATEFGLLHYLMVNANVVVSKAQIIVGVWPEDFEGSDNVVELYIGYLRRKIDDGREPLIHTRRGMGYILRRAD